MKRFFLAAALAVCLLLSAGMAVQAAKKDDDEIKVRRVEISTSTATVRVNQTRTLFELVTPANADDPSVTWASSNEDVAMVDGDGVVTGISPGTATITATAHNGRQGACVVTVPEYALRGAVGDVSAADHPGASVEGGETLSVAAIKAAVVAQMRVTAAGETAQVDFFDKTRLTPQVLRAAAYTAEYEGGQVRLVVYTSDSGSDPADPFAQVSVQGSITVDPHRQLPEWDIAAGVYTDPAHTAAARAYMEAHYANSFAYVHLEQRGDYGLCVGIAARPDLGGLDTLRLQLYVYNSADQSVTRLQEERYTVDGSGFLRFSTTLGGTVVVTDRDLIAR